MCRWFDSTLRHNHIVERVYWQAEIPISQAKGTSWCEKTTNHNIGVKSLSVAGANPARSKEDGSVIS